MAGSLDAAAAHHKSQSARRMPAQLPGHPMDLNARISFSAHGVIKQSEFGISFGIPAPGTTRGVSDEVSVIVETEFSTRPGKIFPAIPQPRLDTETRESFERK